MKKRMAIAICALLLFICMGCGSSTTAEQAEPTGAVSAVSPAQKPTAVSTPSPTLTPEPVMITVEGSTSVGPVIEALAEKYMRDHPNVTIKVNQTDSDTGIAACGEGEADIGMTTNALTEEQQTLYLKLSITLLCRDGIAVVVNAENPVDGLTLDEIKDIFLGKITNWSKVGGDSEEILLYSRDHVSGIRQAFEHLLQISIDDNLTLMIDSSGDSVLSGLDGDLSGIGYASMGLALGRDGIKALAIDGIAPTEENLLSGEYWLYRDFVLLTSGEPQGEVAAFIDFCLNNTEALAYMESKGYYIP